MGGGHVTRPRLNAVDPNPNDPMTEFYQILQRALERGGRFRLPGAYVAFAPPAGTLLYEDTVRDYCRFSDEKRPGYLELFPPAELRFMHQELNVILAGESAGAPAAVLLTEESSRLSTAVQLLPPPWMPIGVPPIPQVTHALTLQLTEADLALADADPARLGRELAARTAGKLWVRHPAIERWLTTALAAAQRKYHREWE